MFVKYGSTVRNIKSVRNSRYSEGFFWGGGLWSTSRRMSKCASRLLSPISFPVYQIGISNLVSLFASLTHTPFHKHSVVARVEPVIYPVSHFGTVQFVSNTRMILHSLLHICAVHIGILHRLILIF
jgi:hypothetical protein